jgi:electron transfer flavoprotein beta subunit
MGIGPADAGLRPPETRMSDPRPIHSIVLAKQVPDTHHLTGDVMTRDGTMNRAALPAIYNPEDLNALEMAVQIRERHGGTVTVITMGPPKAANILRESLWRGADRVVLLTDRAFAGADTLATSLALQKAIEKIGRYDLILAGRQAIDGDTAQVGPQTAEKLGIPQITYAESILEIADGRITAERALDTGTEIVRCTLPCLLTVVGSANTPRPPSARRRIAHRLAATPGEYDALRKRWPELGSPEELDAYLGAHDLRIPVWTADDIGADAASVGLAGSPTQVHKVAFVVLESTESKTVEANPEAIAAMVAELVHEYIVG